VLGMGFTFDDAAAAKGEAENLATMRALIAKNPENAKRIFPYIGGDPISGQVIRITAQEQRIQRGGCGGFGGTG
jgi:hypothetical protein